MPGRTEHEIAEGHSIVHAYHGIVVDKELLVHLYGVQEIVIKEFRRHGGIFETVFLRPETALRKSTPGR